jgi:peptide chain release factor subunit 1
MALDEKERSELEEFIERMRGYRARHTELITVLVPAGFDINLITKQLESEKSTATNIKSTGTRKNVQEALESLIRITKGMKKAPKNGIALFSGNVSQTEGQDNFITEAFEPPEELGVRLYRCDQTFVIDPLDEILEIKELYGLIVIERNEATIGLLVGKKIKVLQKFESFIPGKTNKGGQSAARYARIKLGKDKDKTSYKLAEVKKALEMGAVDTLFISKKLGKKDQVELEKIADKTAVKIELISNETEEGIQFLNLGGVGAILRFKIK